MDIKAEISMQAAVTQQVFPLTVTSGRAIGLDAVTAIQTIAGEHYQGPYLVVPSPTGGVILSTEGKIMDEDVTVTVIPYWETSNPYGGNTVYIADPEMV